MDEASLKQKIILQNKTIDLIQEVQNIDIEKCVPYQDPKYAHDYEKEMPVRNLLLVISRLYYENGPTSTLDFAKESYGYDRAWKIYERVVNRHLCPKNENEVIDKENASKSPIKSRTINVIEFKDASSKYYIYPLALFLKITKKGSYDLIDLTSIDSFNTNFNTISGKVIINICKSSPTLKDFLQHYQHTDHRKVIEILRDIAKNMSISKNKDNKKSLNEENETNLTEDNKKNLFTIKELKNEVDFHLKHYSSFFNLRGKYPENDYFTPRENLGGDILQQIHENLSSRERKSESIVILSGLGGSGKTQLAIEYAYRHEKDIKIICWVNAENRDSLENGYLELMSFLKIPSNKVNNRKIIDKIKGELNKRDDWLIIFDNVSKMENLEFLPGSTKGRIIITSRYSDWPNMGKNIPVREFTEIESREYIFKSLYHDEINRKGYNADEEYLKIVDDLAYAMGYLPLALSQACAYIRASGISIYEYINLFKERKLNIFEGFGSLKQDYPGYPDSVATTWCISIKHVKKSYLPAISLLRLFAFMAPEPLKINQIKKGYQHLPLDNHHIFHPIFCDDLCMYNAISCLRDYSLICYEKGILSLHILVQLVTRYSIEKRNRSMWIEAIIKTILEILPNDTKIQENRETYNHLLPHISNILILAEEEPVQHKNINDIMFLINKVSIFLYNTSEFEKHIEYQKRKLNLCKNINDLLGMAKCFTQIGNDYNRLGKYEMDKRCQTISLDICTMIRSFREGDKNDINLKGVEADCYINLGKANHNLCKYKEAIDYYNKSLSIYREIICKEGEADCYINLGVAYYRLSRFEDDIECQNKGLTISQELGDESRISKCYTNLSNALLVLGDFDEAVQKQERSLDYCREWGDKQGESTCLNNLGVIFHYNNDYENANECLMKSIDINQKIGEAEGNTKSYGNLGNVFSSQRAYNEGIKNQEICLKICTKIKDLQGESTVYYNLGNICYSQGDYEKAINHYTNSLEICQDTDDMLGELKCYTGLSVAYDSCGDFKNATEFEEKRRKLNTKISNLNNGARCYIIQGDVYNRLA